MHGLRRHVAGLKDRVEAARGALCWSDGVSQLQLSLYLNPTQPDPLLLPQPRQACYRSLSLCLYTLSAPHSLSNTGPLRRKTCPSAKTTSINSISFSNTYDRTVCCLTSCIIVLHPQSGSCFTTSSVYTNIPPATAVTTTAGTHQVSPPAVRRGTKDNTTIMKMLFTPFELDYLQTLQKYKQNRYVLDGICCRIVQKSRFYGLLC